MKGFVQDPQSTLDYIVNWEPWLDGDTISTSVWTLDSPLVSVSESNTTLTTTIFISGGNVNINYSITNTITTAGGRQNDRSFELRIRNR